MFIPLHAHSANGSLKDSVLNIGDYIKKAKDLGLTHIALTDHGSMSAVIEFYVKCKAADIIPIIGLEAYICDDMTLKDKDHRRYNHVVLLAKNQIGLRHIIEIHNKAQIDGMYYKPRIDMNAIKKIGGEGIIALSACVAGEIPQAILANDAAKATELVREYKSVFEDFYLELQPGIFNEQFIVNSCLLQLAKTSNTPFTVTTDIHYLNAEDYEKHNLHLKACRKDEDIDSMVYPDKCYYLMSENELLDENKFKAGDKYIPKEFIQQAIRQTEVIANMCAEEFDWDFRMPEFTKVPNKYGKDTYVYLIDICLNSLSEKLGNINDIPAYVKRMWYELEVINQLKFCDYFLIIWDLIKYAKDNNIAVGPGRGSCGGSLVAWLLGITVADPIKYGLMFERFLSINRTDFPDIDLDFDANQRYLLQQYTAKTYGIDCCALVGTTTFRKTKNAVKDIARLLGVENRIANNICKLIPNGPCAPANIEEAVNTCKELKQYELEYPRLFELAAKIENLPTGEGVHAAGIVISPISLMDRIPLRVYEDKDTNTKLYATTINKKYIEKVAIKFDYLALDSVNIITETKLQAGIEVNLLNDNFYNDKEVWDAIGSRNTDGIFQLSSKTYKDRMPRLKPKNIKELAACLALVRSPCIMANADKLYMDICEGKAQIQKVCKEYDEIMKDTNGICIYQEQLIKLCVAFGFSSDEANDIRKACSKKILEKMKSYEVKFKELIAAKGYGQDIQNKLYQILLDSASYSFNASHATCYAILAYESAWLKVHYNSIFMANLLTNAYVNKNKDMIRNAVKSCKQNGIKFQILDINESDWKFKAIDNNTIRVGLCAVPSLGEKAVQEIKDKKPYSSLADANERNAGNKVRRNIVVSLILSGAFCMLEKKSIQQIYEEYLTMKKVEVNYEYELSKSSDIKFNIQGHDDFGIMKKMLGVDFY